MNNSFKNQLLLIILFSCNIVVAQVGIGTNKPNVNSVLEIASTKKGIVFPKVTLVTPNNSQPFASFSDRDFSMFVYNTTLLNTVDNTLNKGFYFWNGTYWSSLGGSSNLYMKNGVLRSDRILNNNFNLTISGHKDTYFMNGRVGLSTTAPSTTLDVAGTAALKVPVGTTNERPVIPTSGTIRQNPLTLQFQQYNTSKQGWEQSTYIPSYTVAPSIETMGNYVFFNNFGTFTNEVSRIYKWYVNNVLQTEIMSNTFIVPSNQWGLNIRCEVTVTHPSGNPTTVSTNEVRVYGIADEYGLSITAAYSLRKLKSSYTGNAIRVRKSSNNQLGNIGFLPNGELNEAALLSFVGTGNGYIETWYDQSGKARNATQTDNNRQPQIVQNGIIIKQNNKPAIRTNSTTSDANLPGLITTWNFNGVSSLTINAILTKTANNPTNTAGLIAGTNFPTYTATPNGFQFLAAAQNSFRPYLNANSVGDSNWGLLLSSGVKMNTTATSWAILQNNNTATTYLNNNSIAQATNFSNGFNSQAMELLGHSGDRAKYFVGIVHEMIFFNKALSDEERIRLNTNQNAYYTIINN